MFILLTEEPPTQGSQKRRRRKLREPKLLEPGTMMPSFWLQQNQLLMVHNLTKNLLYLKMVEELTQLKILMANMTVLIPKKVRATKNQNLRSQRKKSQRV